MIEQLPGCDFDAPEHDIDRHNRIEETHPWHLNRYSTEAAWRRYWTEIAERCEGKEAT